jgi:hypothetical protein
VSLSEIVQRPQDHLDIQKMPAGYCRHADLLDAAGTASYFTDDCVVAYGWHMSHMQLVRVGELGGARIAEQFGGPWPPRFE